MNIDFKDFAKHHSLSTLLWEEGVYASEQTQTCYELYVLAEKQINELTQALLKEQEEVSKYKPIYLKLVAENTKLKQDIKKLSS